jgi:(p)ppGpp synthase/HD superfamily hydrolase
MLLSRAIEIAAEHHAQQLDKSSEPYILHPLRVMQRARLIGLSIAHQCAAVLHDVIEDTACTYGELMEFDEATAIIVHDLTRPAGETYNDFIDRIAQCSSDTIRLKLCDISDNMRSERLTTDELKNMAATRYKPAVDKLERELTRRNCEAGNHCWTTSGGKTECNDCGVLG